MRKKLLGAVAFAGGAHGFGQRHGLDSGNGRAALQGQQHQGDFPGSSRLSAAIKLLPEFEKKTGIKVNYEIVPYENSREKQVLDFTGGVNRLVLADLVWIGEFAGNGWIAPIGDPDDTTRGPELNLKGFFPILIESFGILGRQDLRPAVRQLLGPFVL